MSRNPHRDHEIFRARVNGASWEALAAEYGLTVNRIMGIVANIRNQIPRPTTSDLKADLSEQLDGMRAIAAQIAMDDLVPSKDRVKAVQAVVSVVQRLSRMYNLDAPVGISTSGIVEYKIIGVDSDAV